MTHTVKAIAYEVTNRRTGETKRYRTSAAALKAMDRIDSAYGACITSRRAIWK